jgi:hypothetical protein
MRTISSIALEQKMPRPAGGASRGQGDTVSVSQKQLIGYGELIGRFVVDALTKCSSKNLPVDKCRLTRVNF